MILGKLIQVDLREYWKHEAVDFTRWLTEPENLDALGDEIGLDITLLQTEAGVGRFSADILAQEETSGKKIVIENQLGSTDHDHLGKILTYAAGIEAEYLVWIVKEVKDEHKQAVDWLNEHTDEKLNFFLVRIELWKIGESAPAPKFFVVSRPNDWTKSVRGSTHEQTELTETKLFLLEFWQQFRGYAATNKPPLILRTPQARHYCDIAIGRSDCHVLLNLLTTKNQIECGLYIRNSKQLFQAFFSHKEAIEKELSLEDALSWNELPGKKASRVRVLRKFEFENSNREEAFAWLVQTCLKFKGVFSKSWPQIKR